MQYLLSYRGFCKFKKEWDILIHESKFLKMRKNYGLVSATLFKTEGITGYTNPIYKGNSNFITIYGQSNEVIELRQYGKAGDSFLYTLPIKYHRLPQYHLFSGNTIKQCIIVSEEIYRDLIKIGLIW